MKLNLSTYYLFKNMVAANKQIKTLTPEEVHDVQRVLLEIMDDIHRVCVKYHLTYVISGGGALGMVRHQGFIPWDDDLDICMPREDYEEFRECFLKEYSDRYYVQEIRSCKNYDLNFMKVRLKGTTFCEFLDPEPEKAGIFIDIFSVENVYENPVRRKIQRILADGLQFICSCMRIRKKRKRLIRMAGESQEAIQAIRLKSTIALPFCILPFRTWLLLTEKALGMNRDDRTRLVTIPTGGQHFNGEINPREWLFPPKLMKFEDREYYGMNQVQAYLTKTFGNYMELPPEEKRERHALLAFELPESKKEGSE